MMIRLKIYRRFLPYVFENEGQLVHSQTAERVQRIKSRVLERKASVSNLKTQLSHNSDNHINPQLQQVSNWLDYAEVSFLGILKQERVPPRTLEDESWLLDQAEFFLERVVDQQLEAIQDMVAKFGPKAQSIG